MVRKILAALMAVLMAAGCCATLAACGKKGGPTHFTWWISVGDTAYYDDYEDNPVLDYISNNMQFKGEGGEEKNISFEFTLPASSTAAITDLNNMLSSGKLYDVMDVSQYSGSIADLYEHGAILDLTEYATDPEVMPNLAAWIADPENADLVPYIYTTLSDGSKKILAIPSIFDQLDNEAQAFGFQYRRDWLVKYGTQPDSFYDPMGYVTDEEGNALYTTPTANPNAGKTFSGSYTLNEDGTERNDSPSQNTVLPEGADGDSWVDDVVFPSGSSDPIYISDWQWMFEIYEKAYADLGIDSYMLSMYYPGYIANGDLASGFGGGGVNFYKTLENEASYGFIEDGFRAYLECMNNWYELGWLDNKFNTRSTDNFYAIDNSTIAAGEVGLWMGNASRLGARMASDKQDSHANGAVVYGCSTPINDIPSYDGDPSTTAYTTQATQSEAETAISGGKGSEYMLQQPYVMFQNEQISSSTVIAASVAESKDLTLLLSFFDYLFSDEGTTMKLMGLNAEQAKDSKLYAEYGFTDGAYTVNEDGTYSYDPVLEQNSENIRYAMTLYRLPGLSQYSKVRYSFAETYLNSRAQWTKYPATGFIAGMINGQCTPDETDTISNIVQPIQENYLFKNVYKFIVGDWELSNSQWTSYCAAVMNYTNRNTKVQNVLNAYNAVFDRLYGTEN